MDKIFNFSSLAIGSIGGVITYLTGGFDNILIALCCFMVLDFITGLIKAIINKNVTSEQTYKGILKKFLVLCVVVLSVILQRLINDAIPLREIIIMFFIANEGISVLENIGEFIPIPEKLKEVLEQLRNNNDSEKGGLMNFDEWVKKYNGKSTDYDGVSEVQCVDLVKTYLKSVFGISAGAWGNAKDYWLNFNAHSALVKNFTKIRNTPELVFNKGDIVVFNTKIGQYGHIAVATGEGNTSYFYSYDQNWNGKPMKKVKHDFKAVYGCLRPKNLENIVDPPTIKTGTYTLTNVRGIYKSVGAASGRKKVKELSSDGKAHATSKNENADAYLKAGTRVTISKVQLHTTGNVWAKIPSGWLCVWEHDINKKFVK